MWLVDSHNQSPEVLASHRGAPLTVHGHLLLVQRVREEGRAVAHAAKAMSIYCCCSAHTGLLMLPAAMGHLQEDLS